MAKSFEKLRHYFTFIFLLLLIQIPKSDCDGCVAWTPIKFGSTCFNGIIHIDGRSGQFSIRKDGVLIVEFSNEGKRLFYGLKPNGRGVFPDENALFELDPITKAYKSNGNEVYKRYESKNLLVYLKNDAEQKTPYILSVSSYNSLTELHYFDENMSNSHKVWKTTDFFNINDGERYIFSYQFAVLEGKANTYYAIYVQYKDYYMKDGERHDYSVSYTLSKFTFTNANERVVSTPIEVEDNFDNRIVSAFIFEEFNCLAVFFMKKDVFQYTMRFYDLENLSSWKEKEIWGVGSKEAAFEGNGIYFKALYLRFEYFALLFFTNRNEIESLKLRIFYVKKDNDYNLEVRNEHFFGYELDTDIRLHEFYKVDNETMLIVTTYQCKNLYFIFVDTYEWYYYMNIRTYKFYFDGYYLREELTVDFYNDFLMFTASVSKTGETFLSSFLMFFSFLQLSKWN